MRRLSNEGHRHRCEVRYVLAWMKRDPDGARQYLDQVRKASARGTQLVQDCSWQWALGNRGRKGDWR